jgi:hypothetical protein
MGVGLPVDELFSDLPATNSDEDRIGIKGCEVASSFWGLGGERVRPRANLDVVDEKLNAPAFFGLLNNLFGGARRNCEGEPHRGSY